MSVCSKVTGVGFFVPDRVVTNDDLSALIDTSDEWIHQRTGIRARRHAPDGMTNVDMAEIAAKHAMDEAGIGPGDIDLLIAATLSPDYSFPSNAPFIQRRLGLGPVAAIDVRNQCTGFLYSIAVADAYIRTGRARRVLVIGSEVQSGGLDFDSRSRDIAVIFGDGAGAFVMEAGDSSDGKGVLAVALHGDGTHAEDLWTDAERSYEHPRLTMEMYESGAVWPKMRGRAVFIQAVKELPEIINEVLAKTGHALDDVDCFAFHQANLRINQWVGSSMNIPDEKIFNNIERYGNTTAATIPGVIFEARASGLIHDGSLVVAAAFGAGFTSAAITIRF
ncbi:MAG: ketoacyl-ACP synthase III [Deltaproteobacteria bacterium]|nr:ketoacyl-ACP synthase III [Deltaproteobacteria bacterium]